MAIEYVNRRDQRYYLLVGKTKTGKAKYHVAMKPNGTLADDMPDGFEFHESPETARVSVRRVPQSRVSAMERDMLVEAIHRVSSLQHFFVEIEQDALVVYCINTDPDEYVKSLGRLLGADQLSSHLASMRDWHVKNAHYSKMLRFQLLDADERLYGVERWCFRGSIDNWITLEGASSLEAHANKYVKHLGKESFFDLMSY